MPQKFFQEKKVISNYLPAVLKENPSGWLIEYYVINPQTEVLTRKKIKLSRITSRYKKLSDARKHVNGMLLSINEKLAGGWNPFYEGEDARMFETLSNVAQLFVTSRQKELRKNTMRSYESFINIFTTWVNRNYSGIYASLFAHSHAIRYMDELFAKANTGATTYNNHIKIARAFFNWMKERCYTRQNPFDSIKPKPKPKKRRIIIPAETRRTISDYLIQTGNTGFLIICKLVYNSLIRPNEINQLQIKHVHLKERYILVPGEIAKNHNTRVATISQDIIADFAALRLENYSPECYLFSSGLLPDRERAGNERYCKEWIKLRKALKLPQEMQLYSLRDTGIFDMLKSGIDNLSVMQHADHSSLDMTTIYANHYDPNLINKIYTNAPKF